MNGLARRLLVHALCLCALLDMGCAARTKKSSGARQFITPEHTQIRLKGKCVLDSQGKPDKHCILLWRIDAIEVEK